MNLPCLHFFLHPTVQDTVVDLDLKDGSHTPGMVEQLPEKRMVLSLHTSYTGLHTP